MMQGPHVGQENSFPLPISILPIHGDIMQVYVGKYWGLSGSQCGGCIDKLVNTHND